MKTKKIRIKQGFTIVELVIVIGVIGVLTAILVPTFINLTNKANEASNQSFVKNLNTAMAMREQEEGKNKTMFEAVEDAKAIGFDVEKLTPVNGRDLVWDSVANRFALLNEDGTEFYSDGGLKGKDEQIWKIYDSVPTTQTFSIYAKSGFATKDVENLKVGFDAGYNAFKTVEYDGTKNVTIRTAGDQCVLTIDAPEANVDFYGFAKEIEVLQVKGQSLHVYGSVGGLSVTKGHVAVEETGIVFAVTALNTSTGSISNGGYIAEVEIEDPATKAAVEEAINSDTGSKKHVGGDYEIGNLGQLEAFRDAVNAGNNFYGRKVKLVSDIVLHDGWKPIGEGTRKVVGGQGTQQHFFTGTAFAGTFDGGNKTISNLNNKGFQPTAERIDSDGNYGYGLFALTETGADIKDLKLENVKIDADKGDSVAALVGFSAGSLTVSNVKVTGSSSIKGVDGIAGIVGRAYKQDKTENTGGVVTITNCSVKANITGVDETGSKGAGILGYANLRYNGSSSDTSIAGIVTIKGCTYEGTVDGFQSEDNLYVRGAQVRVGEGGASGKLI